MTPLYEDRTFFDLLATSYFRLLGRPLVPDSIAPGDRPAWLYDTAPFGILAHNTEPDPIFVYGNRSAQQRFEYDWAELTALPSRLSAEAPDRQERADFLAAVSTNGFIEGYRGMRISKSGKRFWIEGVTVWQLTDTAGIYRGQAAMLP